MISIQSQSWTRNRSIEENSCREVEITIKFFEQSIIELYWPKTWNFFEKFTITVFVFVLKKCHCSSILLFWRELWKLFVATAELKSDKHLPNFHKMNNRKFFFERYLIFNYLSNFSTWTWADRISFCCIWGDSVVLCFSHSHTLDTCERPLVIEIEHFGESPQKTLQLSSAKQRFLLFNCDIWYIGWERQFSHRITHPS